MPIYELWRQATKSNAAATTFLVALVCIVIFIGIAMHQTASHLLWAMARDNGIVFSGHLSEMHPTLSVPIWALLANGGAVLITGCIYLASSAAFNALVSCSIILQMVSFAMPCLLLMMKKRSSDVLPNRRPFKLPSAIGWIVNAIVVAFAVVEIVFFEFPSALPVSGSSMSKLCNFINSYTTWLTDSTIDYASAVLAIMAGFGLINWYAYARRHYAGPRIVLE